MKSTPLILAAGLGLAITSTALAQDQNQDSPHRGRAGGAVRARILQRLDTDKDGKLSEQERKAARDAWLNRAK